MNIHPAEKPSVSGAVAISPQGLTPAGIAFSWVLLLRWGTVLCQIVLIGAVRLLLEIEVPFFMVSLIIVFEGASNLYFARIKKTSRIPHWFLPLVMFLDVGLLTLLLYYTGGPMNPFTFLFLVHIVVGAIIMTPKWSWGLVLFTSLCYALLFLPSLAVDTTSQVLCHIDPQTNSAELMEIHLHGMWLAFALTSLFIVFFVGRIQQALANYQKAVSDLKEERVKSEKLTSLATLAAGAAHEFATPLATIAVAAGEMHRHLKINNGSPELIDDAQLIRRQIETCKDILYQMSADAGEPMGEAPTSITLGDFLTEISKEYPADRVILQPMQDDLSILMPPRTLKRTIKGLIKNGLDASPEQGKVTVSLGINSGKLFIAVQDTGSGMDEGTRQKAMDPFFTTKQTGKGLGLGLFLARSIAERYEGEVTIDSSKEKGTTAVISFNLAMISYREDR